MACGPEIGDACESNLDCSTQNSRPCDRTQPGGYCTIVGCEARTCPEEAVCVKFRPETERLAATYCMLSCSDDSDCRSGYRCLSEGTFGRQLEGEQEALVLDGSHKKFCAVLAPMSMPDGGMPPIADAGMIDR